MPALRTAEVGYGGEEATQCLSASTSRESGLGG